MLLEKLIITNLASDDKFLITTLDCALSRTDFVSLPKESIDDDSRSIFQSPKQTDVDSQRALVHMALMGSSTKQFAGSIEGDRFVVSKAPGNLLTLRRSQTVMGIISAGEPGHLLEDSLVQVH
ncbi:MAG: hypothetical protein K8F91_09430 [Candidatus Obscuribacterales bacterium]|nr:hypothetical protein [Candidatus Obscuribacterales bacterium]